MYKESILDNGIKIITLLDSNAPTATLAYLVKCGSFNEDKDNLGIAHFTEHMLFKGTLNRTSDKINWDIENFGGLLNAETFFNYTKYYCTVPYEYWKIGLDVLSDIVWFNTIPEDEFSKEKQVILEELKMCEDDPSGKVFDLLMTQLNKNYINRQLVGGTNKTVSKIKHEQIIDFIDQNYNPNNIVIVATGNINHDEIVEFIEDFCKDIDFKKSPIQKIDLEFKIDTDYKEIIEKREIAQSHLCWGLFGPKPNTDEIYILDIISTLLGGNSSSILYQIIREQMGLVYTVYTNVMNLGDTSTLYGYAGLDQKNIKKVKKIIIDELLKLQNELVDEEKLDFIKRYIKGTYALCQERTSGKNTIICECIINDLDYENYIEGINNIKIEDIKEFAKKYFSKDKIQFVQILPK